MQLWNRLLIANLVVATLVVPSVSSATAAEPEPRLLVACDEGNDVWQALVANRLPAERRKDAATAVADVRPGDGVLVLAEGYPDTAQVERFYKNRRRSQAPIDPGQPTEIDEATLDAAAKKGLRLYVEYPAALPGLKTGAPLQPTLERLVVNSDFFGQGMPKLQILGMNGMTQLPLSGEIGQAHLMSAKVAGFETAPFGLPKDARPVLFFMPDGNVLVATTKLSQFITGRYGPKAVWGTVWNRLIGWALGDAKVELKWTPAVRASYSREEALPADVEAQALRRGLSWFERSKLLLDATRAPEAHRAEARGALLPPPSADAPIGDGSLGIMEAPMSIIHTDGRQTIRPALRGDCHAETAMALSLGAKLSGNDHDRQVAENLLDFYLLESDGRKGQRGDPASPAYGLISWGIGTRFWLEDNYGDDNARLLLGALATAAATNQDRWDEAMALCLLANLRTTGPGGLRPNTIPMRELQRRGWRHYFEQGTETLSPHFQAWLWACYAWAYAQSGEPLFLERAEAGFRQMMEAGPEQWRGVALSSEKARMLLPLAWLVRAKDTPEHRKWLDQAVQLALELQQSDGAIREEMGDPSFMHRVASNADYGKDEAVLVQQDGDPMADMLYTNNFAFIGLHEAAAATGNPDYKKAEDKLAEFLCRAQARSETHPELDGGWFRGFDYRRWEAWGPNADAGWGVWAIESGWTQGWITATLALRQSKTSLWDLTADSKVGDRIKQLREQMIPEK